jgi:hypothetical protein
VPASVASPALAAAVAFLAYSFTVDVIWLLRRP